MPAFKRGKKSRPSSAAETSSTPSQGVRETGEPLERFKSTGISNLFSVSKPFKSAEYKSNRRWKNLKQVVAQEQQQQQQAGERLPVDFPVYWNIDAPPSLKPQKKYCDITGLPAEYTDPKTNIRYHSAEVYQIVRTLPPGTEQEYLALRNASVTLK